MLLVYTNMGKMYYKRKKIRTNRLESSTRVVLLVLYFDINITDK